MPSLSSHPAVSTDSKRGIVKALVLGESGSGKTGALASLVDAGYKLRVLDFDAGLDPLAQRIKNKSLLKTHVSYVTLRDQFEIKGNFLKIKKAPSFQTALQMLEEWDDGEQKLGAVETWGDDTILVIDTLSKMSKYAFNMVLQANGVVRPSGEKGGPEQSHYGAAQENITRLLQQLTNPDIVPCHLIVNSHISYQEDGSGMARGFPETIGKSINSQIARDFNNMLGFGMVAGERKLHTKRLGTIALKVSKPDLPEHYPIATSYADLFKALAGAPPSLK